MGAALAKILTMHAHVAPRVHVGHCMPALM